MSLARRGANPCCGAVRAALGLLAFVASGLCARPATAQDDTRPLVEATVTPIFGQQGLLADGWGEVLVNITNRSPDRQSGEVRTEVVESWGRSALVTAGVAPFALSAEASANLQLPLRLNELDDATIRVVGRDGRSAAERTVQRSFGNQALLVDAREGSALGSQLSGLVVATRHWPWMRSGSGYPPGGAACEVAQPPTDAATGDVVMPHYAAGYARVGAVLIGSGALARLDPDETAALGEYVLSGGTLAVVITRPEDVRAATLSALLAGEAHPVAADGALLREIEVDRSTGSNGRMPPAAAAPEPEVARDLVGYAGGNLRPSLYGASAPYGLGEVHLLGFDPSRRPAVDSPWIHIRMVDLLRRAVERRGTALLQPGNDAVDDAEVRKLLDPNEGSRWAVILSALLLCAYAVGAGPLNFSRWRRRGRPLAALPTLALMSAATFGGVVVVGVAAKGCSGRARHLSVIEAGAGMEVGSVKRFRGYYAASSSEMTVWPWSRGSVLAVQGERGDRGRLVIDGEGLRLEGVSLEPWETVVVREDGVVDLGMGVALLPAGTGDVRVVNRSGRALVGLILKTPRSLDQLYLARLADGEAANSTDFTAAGTANGRSSGTATRPVTAPDFYAVERHFEAVDPGLSDAWQAVSRAAPDTDWFPRDVPTLLAALEDGEGQSSDGGYALEVDRVLVRVVGFGGAER